VESSENMQTRGHLVTISIFSVGTAIYDWKFLHDIVKILCLCLMVDDRAVHGWLAIPAR
jgi:hypothetical protein